MEIKALNKNKYIGEWRYIKYERNETKQRQNKSTGYLRQIRFELPDKDYKKRISNEPQMYLFIHDCERVSCVWMLNV